MARRIIKKPIHNEINLEYLRKKNNMIDKATTATHSSTPIKTHQ